MLNELEVIGVTVFSAFLASFAQFIFKKNLVSFKPSLNGLFSAVKNKWIITGLMIYLVSLPIYLFALENGDLSFVYPTFASSFIFVILFSKFGVGERIGITRIAGVLLIVVGIAIIAMTF